MFNLIFVNLIQRQTAGEQSGPASRASRTLWLRRDELFERRTYDMKCNWKTYVDNYLEGYHLLASIPD